MILSSNSSSRPPAQVFTRGATGSAALRRRTPLERRHSEGRLLALSRCIPTASAAATTNTGSSGNPNERRHCRHLSTSSTPMKTAQSPPPPSPISINNNNNNSADNRSVTSASDETISTRNSNSKLVIPTTNGSSSPDVAKHVLVIRRVIEDLTRAQGATERRLTAGSNACELFDHTEKVMHNVELNHGAAAALAKLLTTSYNDYEIRMLLSATEMVFRGSPKAVAAAYQKMNGSLFLRHLLRLLGYFETRRVQHAEISILSISRILHSCSRASELRAAMAQHPDLLLALSRVSSSVLSPECRLYRVRIIANLANCEENKVPLYEQKGMLDSILRIGHFDTSAITRQYAGMTLMELSSAPLCQVSMARNETVLGTLVKMILVETLAPTRECAITALQNLAFAKENRSILVSFKNGIVLEALKKALSSDIDTKARRRSAGALTNLACDETAAAMGNHKGLLHALAIVSSTDESLDVQARASLALTKIAGSITVQADCHPALLDALVVASLSKASNSVSAVLRIKARSPENRQALARHPGVMDTLADICISESAAASDRDNSIRAIMHLVNEDKNRIVLCNKTILTAVVTAANYNDPDLDEARDSSIRAMERLATEVSNRPVMAHHEGLIVAVAKAVEREALWEQLGHDTEYGRLAKPLLMSLLVAM